MQDKNERAKSPRDKATTERRMALAQCIRLENQDNRMKIRQREKILYGRDTQPPLYDMGALQNQNTYQPYADDQMQETGISAVSFGTFKYRMMLAVLLFVGFLLCDTNDREIVGYTTNEVNDMIMADTFHLYEGDGNEVMEGIAEGLAELLP